MTPFVVDTNVAIVANGRGTHADLQCQLTCAKRLESLAAGEVVAIDDRGLILKEYTKHMNSSGNKGAGDVFFKHVFVHQYQKNRVLRVAITPSEDDRRGFEELPENTFDSSDRKFLVVAATAKAVVLNATDSDWAEQEALMKKMKVEVSQLCSQYALKIAQHKQ